MLRPAVKQQSPFKNFNGRLFAFFCLSLLRDICHSCRRRSACRKPEVLRTYRRSPSLFCCALPSQLSHRPQSMFEFRANQNNRVHANKCHRFREWPVRGTAGIELLSAVWQWQPVHYPTASRERLQHVERRQLLVWSQRAASDSSYVVLEGNHSILLVPDFAEPAAFLLCRRQSRKVCNPRLRLAGTRPSLVLRNVNCRAESNGEAPRAGEAVMPT